MPHASRFQQLRELAAGLGLAGLANAMVRNLAAFNLYHRMVFPLHNLTEPPSLRAGYNLTTATADDFAELTAMLADLPVDDRRELLVRTLFFRRGFERCYLLRDAQSAPVFLQWLVYPADNPLIRRHYRHRFAPLPDRHAMLENAYCFPRFRGFGWLHDMTRRLLWLARRDGYLWCAGYVRAGNLASLNCFADLGFRHQRLIPEIKLLGMTRRLNQPGDRHESTP